MTRDELIKVLDRTLEQTKKRQVKWRPGATNALALSFPRSSLQIVKSFDSTYQRTEYALNLYNSVGNMVATIDYENFTDGGTREKLENLYHVAYVIAYEIDETIGDILGGLGS